MDTFDYIIYYKKRAFSDIVKTFLISIRTLFCLNYGISFSTEHTNKKTPAPCGNRRRSLPLIERISCIVLPYTALTTRT